MAKRRIPLSPRVVPSRPRKPRAAAAVAALPARKVYAWTGNQPSFPPRRTPFSPAELAGLEIPAFLKRAA